MSSVTFAIASASDWPRIDALFGAAGPERAHFLRGVAGAGVWILACQDGVAVGTGEVRRHFETWEIANLIVAPRARRRGIGTALLTALLNEAAARGAEEVVLLVAERARAARRIYRKAGFRPVTVRRLSGGTALLMRARLR